MPDPITYLFVPGDRPDRFDKALAAGADAVILDLEDAVAPQRKAEARAACARWLAGRAAREGVEIVVRVNAAATPWFAEDLAMLREQRAVRAMLPKVEAPGDVEQVAGALGPGRAAIALIESARGVAQVDAIVRSACVARLAFGNLDYVLDLGLSGDERGLVLPMCAVALASRVAGKPAPIAGVTTAIDDEAALLADVVLARACGFAAKLCIHPKQLAVIRRGFAPTGDEIAWAQRVVDAVATAGGAVVRVDGQMVDRPVLERAQAILARGK